MSTDKEIASLVSQLEKFKPGKPLKNYISYAVFPHFKCIEPGTKVDFDFPFTALVGANGIGKSSLLHALWGMPMGYSTRKFWFATALDPITSDKGAPQRYFYGHWNESYKGIVETRKARIGVEADYWEPYRWSKRDGMAPLPEGEYEGKVKDRWNPVKRKVIYINLKATFGSFDRFFYFDDYTKGDELRRVMMLEAQRLKRIKETGRQSFKLGGGEERLFVNRDLNSAELYEVGRILGRTYESARLIKHSLYPGARGKDMSVVFKRGSEYSEAFAGSGEIAAVRVVVDVLEADEYSLILLDEPETSLHPGAQRALLRFLLEQIKLKKHQIVMSTHSPEFLNGLPVDAIKVFEDNGNFQARVIPSSSPEAALVRLGSVPQNKLRVLVEDQLSEMLLSSVAKRLDPGDLARLEIKVSPGGGEFMLKFIGPTLMDTEVPVFMMLDGDKRKVSAFTSPETLSLADEKELTQLISKEIGTEPCFCLPGGSDKEGHQVARIQAQKQYLEWLKGHTSYLPGLTPEQIILEVLEPGMGHEKLSAADAKKAYIKFVSGGVDIEDPSASDILAWSKLKLAALPATDEKLDAIKVQLSAWLNSKR